MSVIYIFCFKIKMREKPSKIEKTQRSPCKISCKLYVQIYLGNYLGILKLSFLLHVPKIFC